MTAIRQGGAADLSAVAAIQQAAAEAAQWPVADYLLYNFLVAEMADRVVGFLVARDVAADEREILNLAIAPDSRRKGLARDLLEECLKGFSGTVFLEVRDSNLAAKSFYKRSGFLELNTREQYYGNPSESAIVMKFHSC